jgi:hypothetical protein
MRLLYHGSNVAVDAPRLVEQVRGLDFGSGFYLTTSEEQAVRFSGIVSRRKKCGRATVNIYQFDIDTAEKTLAVRKFDGAGLEWLRFVVENRLKTYRGEGYDMVIGAVANDTVMPTIQAHINGFINEEAALIALKTGHLFDQVCLKTEKALSLLKFVEAYNPNE